MSAVDNTLYPSINTKIKYQQDWQKDFYHKKLSEFKVSPVGFNKIVFIAPIFSPILIKSNISTIGIAIIDISIVFICLIQKYINNVYLANNE